MEFYEVIESRRSVRAYVSEPVEDEKLDRVLNAARLAPSAANRQPVRFYAIRDT
ncbi:MAG: nitroreductase family protein, partial [Planctomycetota bacterium]